MTTTKPTAAQIETLVQGAVDVIAIHSQELAQAWLDQPWRRFDLACGFAAGFAKNDTDDPHPHAQAVLDVVALLQRNQG